MRIVLDFITDETNDFHTHSVKPFASDSIFLFSLLSKVWQSIALVWGLPSQIQLQPPHPPAPSPPEGGEGEKKSQDLIRRVARLLPIERNKNLTSRGHFPQIVEFRCIIAADRNLTVCYHDAKLVTILPAALVADPIAESVP